LVTAKINHVIQSDSIKKNGADAAVARDFQVSACAAPRTDLGSIVLSFPTEFEKLAAKNIPQAMQCLEVGLVYKRAVELGW